VADILARMIGLAKIRSVCNHLLAALRQKNEQRATVLQTISRLFEKSAAAEFGFSFTEFCELVADVTQRSLGENHSTAAQTQFIQTLHVADLVLARACARGHSGGWERFIASYRPMLYAAALGMTHDASAARELADSLYADLFGTRIRPDGRRNSKLQSYLGRGPLEGWLRMVLAQQFVNQLRAEKKLVAFDESFTSHPETKSLSDSQLDHSLLSACADAALATLSAEERLLLAAYYLDGRTLAEIGRMLRLHESSVSRRLSKVTEQVRKDIIRRLRSAGLSKREAEEMLHSDVSDIGVNVRDRLAQERQA
jgi:RNA polymerase sigma-70 factor (ECF subfamily)